MAPAPAFHDAVPLKPNGPYRFLPHIVIKKVGGRKNRKGFVNRHFHHRIDRILPPLSAPQRFRYKIEFRSLSYTSARPLKRKPQRRNGSTRLISMKGLLHRLRMVPRGDNISKHDSLIVPYFERSFGRQIRLAVGCNRCDVTEPQTLDHLLQRSRARSAGSRSSSVKRISETSAPVPTAVYRQQNPRGPRSSLVHRKQSGIL
jgi:hypothetical protein